MNAIVLASVTCLVLVFGTSMASAETLSEALASAYTSNPTLRAERARQRGTDEQIPQALSGWRPTVTAQGGVEYSWSDNNVSKKSENHPSNISISLSQPIFRGFKTINGTLEAEANVQAGRQNLLALGERIIALGQVLIQKFGQDIVPAPKQTTMSPDSILLRTSGANCSGPSMVKTERWPRACKPSARFMWEAPSIGASPAA